MLSQRNPRVNNSRIALVPRTDVPRSTFMTRHTLKTTYQTGYLIPFHIDEVLPGDVHQGHVTLFQRLATPLFPIMDSVTTETFFFFVPARIVWTNFVKMMGERTNPADSISYTLPQIVSPAGGFPIKGIYDYFGLPTVGQVGGGNTISINALPLRAYNQIFNDWFRDENLDNNVNFATDNTTQVYTTFALQRRRKRKDYFTSALPWPLKGGVDVTLPLAGKAWVKGIASDVAATSTAGPLGTGQEADGTSQTTWPFYFTGRATGLNFKAQTAGPGSKPDIYADMTAVTGATINALRLAFQTQRLLERDARAGTRYTEIIRAHFGVEPEDMRLQRAEYLGGGRTAIQTQAIPQTSATGITGGSSSAYLGSLGAASTATGQHSFSLYAREHGYIIGLIHTTAEITYQQGMRRLWTRQTRYDHYMPVFQALGEQAIRNDEIYCDGSANDALTFGYQERWAEYREFPSIITGLFRSTSAGTIDPWHLAQKFTSLPALNSTFITDQPPLARALAAGTNADDMQVMTDAFFQIKRTRPMPMYSIPGNVDRF